MSDILVTIVLPIYNVEKHLNRSIESIVGQTYKNIEIILVDDGSPDKCPSMCDEWAKKDNRIRVIHKENAGLGMARNSGIESAKGDYICFFDSDDFVESDLIEKCIKVLKGTFAQIVVFGYDRLDKNGKTVVSSVPELPKQFMCGNEIKDFVIPCLAGPMIKDGKKYHMSSSAWAAMYSMRTIKENQFRFVSEREIISEDVYSNLIYYQYIDSIAILPHVLYHYCEDNNQSLTSIYNPERFGRNKYFYFKSQELCDNLGYCEQTKKNLSNQMLGNIIAIIKQIIELNLPFEKKKEFVLDILNDEITKNIISDYDTALDGKSFRRILVYCIKHKYVNTLFMLISLKNIAIERK